MLTGVAGYYEPLHESLGSMTAATLPRSGPHAWASGHPELERPYFDEFAPLLRSDAPGVRFYRNAFATDDFFAASDAPLPSLKSYLEFLIAAAHERGKQPVLKFCRSLGRVGWMARSFPSAVHIAVIRNPVSQFIAAKHQFVAHENPYFLLMPFRVLARNQAHAPVAEVIARFAVSLPLGAADEDGTRARTVLALHLSRTEPEIWYRGFLAFWLLTLLGIPATVDAIIDADLFAALPDYRAECTAKLAGLAGIEVALDGARRPSCCAGRVTGRLGFTRAALWRHHATVSAFLAERHGPDWMEHGPLVHTAALLARATLLGVGHDQPLRARTLTSELDTLAAYAERLGTDLRRSIGRAERAERELAAVYRSSSWKITAPLRFLGTYLRLLRRSLVRLMTRCSAEWDQNAADAGATCTAMVPGPEWVSEGSAREVLQCVAGQIGSERSAP